MQDNKSKVINQPPMVDGGISGEWAKYNLGV